MSYTEKIVIVGGGVAGIAAATKLVDNGYPGNLITIIDKGKDPYNRKPNEVMCGFNGAGLMSDGKYSYLSNTVGGQLTKYCGEEKAQLLIDEGLEILLRFHPKPEEVMYSAPKEEPEFIKPYFNLRMSPTHHMGTNYLQDMGKVWYDYLVSKGIKFLWETEVTNVNFINNALLYLDKIKGEGNWKIQPLPYDKLIYCTGKSGIDLTQRLIDDYQLKKESKSVQLGVRFEAPQQYFQNILDIAYDFKLYQKKQDISVRSFCTNSQAAYVAEEETYDMKSYNGHSFKDLSMVTNMVNFGIIMEIKGIQNPFQFQKDVVAKCQIDGKGIHYSPNFTRKPSLTAEGENMNLYCVEDLTLFKESFKEYSDPIIDYIEDLNKIFHFGNDYSLYIPEVKFLSEEVLTNYNDLSLIDYPNVHFIGDALSARGIAVSMAQGLFCVESILSSK